MPRKSSSEPLLLSLIALPFRVIGLILYLVFTILTLGIFLIDEKEEKVKEPKGPSLEEMLRVKIARREKRLEEIRPRIRELNDMKEKLLRNEKRYFFMMRLIIALMILGANIWYLSYLKNETCFDLSKAIEGAGNLNSCILLLYSLPAFILYGSVGRFSAAMRSKVLQILRKRHIPTLTALNTLKKEENQLINEIGNLKLMLADYE